MTNAAILRELRRLTRDERGFLSMFSSSLMDGGAANFALTYTGTTSGVWSGGAGSVLPFTIPGAWFISVTTPVVLDLKGCGPGGFGWYPSSPAAFVAAGNNSYGGGGGGGSYHLGLSITLQPAVLYDINVAAAGSESPTWLAQTGVAYILHMGGGQNGGTHAGENPAPPNPQAVWNGGLGGVSGAGGGSSGGYGGTANSSTGIGPAQATSGTGGGGRGGGGNLGGTGGFAGFTGADGETAGVASSAATGYNGGDGGYGGGLIINGIGGYGRGGGGIGESGDGVGKTPVYATLAGNGALQFTRTA